MATFLLIGPSGVGKSSSSKILSEISDIEVYDLDKFLKDKIGCPSLSNFLSEVGNEKFFAISKEAIEEIENLENENSKLVVIGAGSINFPHSHHWFAQKNLIALIGDPEVIYERGNRKQFHPQIDGYLKTEFNDLRLSLYSKSRYTIDVTALSCEETAIQLRNIIKP